MCDLFDKPDPTPPPPPKKPTPFLSGAAQNEQEDAKKKKTGMDTLRVDLETPSTGSGLAV